MTDENEIEGDLLKVQAVIDLLADAIHLAGGELDKPLIEEIVGEMLVGPNAKLDRLTSERITRNENELMNDYLASR